MLNSEEYILLYFAIEFSFAFPFSRELHFHTDLYLDNIFALIDPYCRTSTHCFLKSFSNHPLKFQLRYNR